MGERRKETQKEILDHRGRQNVQVTCSGMGFRGVINVILRKQIGMSRSFSLFQPPLPPPPSPTQQLEDVHAPFVF